MFNLGGIGADPPGKPVPLRATASPGQPSIPTNPADVVQLQTLAASAPRPEYQALAKVALRTPELAAHAVHSATLQAISQGINGQLPQMMARVALDAMKTQPDLKSRAVIGHTYLEAMGNNPVRLATIEDPLAAQTYQTSLLGMLEARTEKAPATRQRLGKDHNPATNLFEYVNGRVNKFWLGLVGGHEGVRGDQLRKEAEALKGDVYKSLLKENPQVQAFHQAVGDMKARDRVGIGPLKPLLDQVDGLQSHEELGALVNHLHRQGLNVLFSPVLYPQQGGGAALHVVPNANVMGTDLHRIKEDYKFQGYAETLFRTAGYDAVEASEAATRVQGVGLHLSRAGTEADYDATTRRYRTSEVSLRDMGYDQEVKTGYPQHFGQLSTLLSQLPLDRVKEFLKYSILNATASELGSEASKANAKSNQRLNAYFDTRPESQTRVHLPGLTQRAFADRVITPERRQRAEQVFQDVKAVFRQRLENAPWLSEEGRQAALDKLDKMQFQIGGPDGGFPVEKVDFKPDRHLENMLALEREKAERKFGGNHENYHWDSDRTEKPNGYYIPHRNTVCATAGYLLDHALSDEAEPAELYGVFGFMLAHEIGHGFEASGTRHDAEGRQRDWLPPQDRQMFEMKIQQVERQLQKGDPSFSHGNGPSFINEAAADLTGLSVAYEAFLLRNQDRTVRDGHNPEQRFWLHFATEFGRRDGNMRRPEDGDVHPANEFRINNTARNMPAYAAAFGLAPGASTMALEQAQRAGLW